MSSRTSLLFLAILAFASPLHGQTPPPIKLEVLPHSVLYDDRTYERSADDRRYSIWADHEDAVRTLLAEFAARKDFDFKFSGGVVAVFFNDDITEDILQIVHNKNTGGIFADCAETGIRFKLRAPASGRKYSHMTIVVFSPKDTPSHLGIRGMIPGGLSEKKD